MSSDTALADQREHIERLRKFSLLAALAAGFFGPLLTFVGWITETPQLILLSLGTLCNALCLFGAYRLATTRPTNAVYLAIFGFLMSAVGGILAMPGALPVALLVPILVLLLALPYLGADYKRVMGITWLATLFIFLAGMFVHIFDEVPRMITLLVVLGTGPTTAGLVVLLLANYHSRLTSLVSKLQQARDTLELQVADRTAQLLAALEETRQSREEAISNRQELERLLGVVQVAQEEAERQAQEARRLEQEAVTKNALLETAVASYLAFTEAIAQGDLSQRVLDHGDLMLDRLGQGLNRMAVSLETITKQVQEAVAAISSAAAEIQAATTQQAASAAQQSASITQTTTTIEEIKSIAQQTAQQAAQVANDSQQTLRIARDGTTSVEDTLGGMQQIRVRVEDIAETILALSEQTQAISAIIQTVNELADQSNLLALNAAIEAARAGEQGKSFAVVAQHVRDLAERSKSATGQVREILGEVQQATATAVLVTEEGTKGVEVGAKLAGQTGQVIHRIAEEVESGAQANIQMAAAAQQQTAGIEQIGQAMLSIQQATTQTLSSTRQAERAARDLTTLAQELTRTLGVYRLR